MSVASAGSRTVLTALAVLIGFAPLAACDRFSGGSTASVPMQPQSDMDAIAAVPLGDLAGAPASTVADRIADPYTGNPQAIQEGHDLFVKMNCAGCHGYGAKGGMGPNLTDGYWRYGGVPVMLFKSIHDGRPQGMPAWNPALPPQEIWKIVAYLESLGGTYPADEFQAAIQGDRTGDNVPATVAAARPPGDDVASTPLPQGGKGPPPAVAPNPDVAPPPGAGR